MRSLRATFSLTLLVAFCAMAPWASPSEQPDSELARAGGGATPGISKAACEAAEHRQFDFWVGQWNVQNFQKRPDAPEDTKLYETGTATADIQPILDGCAVVEHWEGRLLPDRRILGFSLRSWDPETERWHVVLNWPAPAAPSFFEIEGAFSGDHGDFIFPGRQGGFVRYRFSGTQGGEPRWAGASAEQREGPWTDFWRMHFTPRREAAHGLRHGRSRSTDHCPGEEFRRFDFLIGEWTGVETVFGSEGQHRRPIAVRSWSILEGCAIVDRVSAGEGADNSRQFRVRSFVPTENRWAQYTLSSGGHRPVRWEGTEAADNRAVMVTGMVAAEPGQEPTMRRVEWRLEGDRLIRTTAFSTGAETWRPLSEASLRAR